MNTTVDVMYRFTQRLAVAMCLIVFFGTAAPAQTVAQLLAPNAHRSDLRTVLAAWGDDAVAPILAAIGRETAASPVRLGVLMYAIRDIETSTGELGLRSLLADSRSYVRATAAKLLVERGARCSVPALTALLTDSSEYSKKREGQVLVSLTVGTVASDALAQLTSLALTGSTSDRQTQIASWWSMNQTSLECGGGQ